MLTAENVTVKYGEKTAVDQVSFHLEEGQWLMLVGPNGAGKSTLIRAIAQTVPWEGSIILREQPLRSMKPADRARRIGVLSQQHSTEYAYTVEEIVRLGRYAHHRGFLRRAEEADEEAIEQALDITGMTEYRNTSMLSLSGGEIQRAFLAQVFAQDPTLLILDEPTNHLDLKYQQQTLDLVSDWLKEPGRAVLSVMHDLSLARKYGSQALLMEQARVIASGAVETVLSRENLIQAYGMDVHRWMRDLLSSW